MDNTRTDISAFHMAVAPDAFETQKTNAFKFIVTDLDPLTDPITGQLIPNAADVLKESVISFEEPSFTQSPIEVRRGNLVSKSAGTPTFTSGSLALHDFVGLATYNVLYAWQAKSFNIKTGRVGLQKDYKKTAYLIEYSTDFSTVIRVWKLTGVWISSLKKTGFDNSSNANEVQIQCSIEYDWATPEDPSTI